MSRRPGFHTPERKRPGKDAFNAQPRRVEQWLADLPRANAGETARRIYQALGDSNLLMIKCRHRVNLLESLREPAQFVNEQMQKHFVGETFPLPKKKRNVAVAARRTAEAMAIGYKIAIEDLLNESILFNDRRTLSLLLHRAITYLNRVLLISYQAYSEFPTDVWADLHKLYAFAESHKVHRVAIADEQHQYIIKTTVEAEYVRALLLFLASPYHLRHGEVGHVHVNLERWIGNVKLVPFTGNEKDGFVINLERDDPPRIIALLDEDCATEACRVLDTEDIIKALETEIERGDDNVSSTLISAGMQDAALPHDLLRKLISAWHATEKRRFSRSTVNETVRAATGMTHIHCGLLKQSSSETVAGKVYDFHRQSLRDMFNPTAEYDARDISDVNIPKSDVWEMVYSNRMSSTEVKGEGGEEDNTDAADASCELDSWTLVNESAGGLFMRCSKDCSTNVQVGEIIAVERLQGDQRSWSLGLIRWMKEYEKEGVQVGVLLLAPDAIPVGVTLAVDAASTKRYQRALLVPGAVASHHQTTLITPPYPFRPGAVVSVFFMGHETRLQLSKQLGNSGLCAQFHFKILKSAIQGKEAAEKEFSDVWNLI